jgi:hypothetical protein
VPEKPTEKQPLYTIEEINKSGSKVFIWRLYCNLFLVGHARLS